MRDYQNSRISTDTFMMKRKTTAESVEEGATAQIQRSSLILLRQPILYSSQKAHTIIPITIQA
jgi:hypothetical protein